MTLIVYMFRTTPPRPNAYRRDRELAQGCDGLFWPRVGNQQDFLDVRCDADANGGWGNYYGDNYGYYGGYDSGYGGGATLLAKYLQGTLYIATVLLP